MMIVINSLNVLHALLVVMEVQNIHSDLFSQKFFPHESPEK